MTGVALSHRPRGVRKHWKRMVAADPSVFGPALREHALCGSSLGEPVEVVRFASRGEIKRLDARFDSGAIVSVRFNKRRTQIITSGLLK